MTARERKKEVERRRRAIALTEYRSRSSAAVKVLCGCGGHCKSVTSADAKGRISGVTWVCCECGAMSDVGRVPERKWTPSPYSEDPEERQLGIAEMNARREARRKAT